MVDVDDISRIAMSRGSVNICSGEAKRARERREEGRIVLEAADTKETSARGAPIKAKT